MRLYRAFPRSAEENHQMTSTGSMSPVTSPYLSLIPPTTSPMTTPLSSTSPRGQSFTFSPIKAIRVIVLVFGIRTSFLRVAANHRNGSRLSLYCLTFNCRFGILRAAQTIFHYSTSLVIKDKGCVIDETNSTYRNITSLTHEGGTLHDHAGDPSTPVLYPWISIPARAEPP